MAPKKTTRPTRKDVDVDVSAVEVQQPELSALTDAQIRADIAKLQAEVKAREERRRSEAAYKVHLRWETLQSMLDLKLVDALAPDHTLSRCTDDARVGSGHGCPRCTLLDLLFDNTEPDVDFGLAFRDPAY